MARRSAAHLTIEHPRAIVAGEAATVGLRVAARRSLTIIAAQVRLVERVRVVNRYLLPLTGGFTRGSSIRAPERLLPALAVGGLSGPMEDGAERLAIATIVAADVAPGCVGVATVQVAHLFEAQVSLNDGTQVTTRSHTVVIPGPGYWPAAPGAGAALPTRESCEVASGPGPWVQFHLDSTQPASPPRGAFRRPITGLARLGAGPQAVRAGRLELHLDRLDAWQEHYPRFNRSVERSKLTSYRLGTLATPEVGVGQEASVAFAVRAPGGMAQTTRTEEGSVTWSLVGRWTSGGEAVTGTLDLVMEMPTTPGAPSVNAVRSDP